MYRGKFEIKCNYFFVDQLFLLYTFAYIPVVIYTGGYEDCMIYTYDDLKPKP